MYGRRLLDGYFFIARICFLAGIGKKMGVFGMIFVVYAALHFVPSPRNNKSKVFFVV